MSNKIDKTDEPKNDQLFSKVAEFIELARKKVATTVNLTMVHTYFEIGRMIVEDEQQGKERAEYGKTVLKDLSFRLAEKFGKGFSVDNLQNMRRFYLTYSIYETSSRKLQSNELQLNTIRKEPFGEILSEDNQLDTFWRKISDKSPGFTLSWSHYIILMRIENPAERRFYEIGALQQNWSEAQLKMQISMLQSIVFICPIKNYFNKNCRNGYVNLKMGKSEGTG